MSTVQRAGVRMCDQGSPRCGRPSVGSAARAAATPSGGGTVRTSRRVSSSRGAVTCGRGLQHARHLRDPTARRRRGLNETNREGPECNETTQLATTGNTAHVPVLARVVVVVVVVVVGHHRESSAGSHALRLRSRPKAGGGGGRRAAGFARTCGPATGTA